MGINAVIKFQARIGSYLTAKVVGSIGWQCGHGMVRYGLLDRPTHRVASFKDGCRTACVRFPPFAPSLRLVQVSNV